MAKFDYSVGAIGKEKRTMSTKTYCKKTAAFAGWLIQNVPEGVDMDRWLKDPEGTKQVLAGFKPEPVSVKPAPLFSILATTKLDATLGKPTSQCFVGAQYAYRDPDFDNWLPASQPEAGACEVTMLGLKRDWKFAEAAAKVLGVGAESTVKFLGEALIANGHTMTLEQAEDMVECTELGEKTGMQTNGYGNFFFVETGDENNPVSVGRVSRGGSQWRASVRSLAIGGTWLAGRRLLVRNLSDASDL